MKRKRYTESIDLHFSGDDDEESTDLQLLAEGGKKQGRSDQQVAEIKVRSFDEIFGSSSFGCLVGKCS